MAILPDTYQWVEYIESTGTQYIDTNYIPTNNTKMKLKIGGWTGFGSYPNLFGARLEWSTTGSGFQLGKTTTGSGDYFAMFGGYLTGLSPSTFSFGDGNDHVIEMSQSGIYEDGTLKQSLSSATFTSPTNMVIFADNENGTVSENGAYKLYYCKIYNNGTLVRDFIPCYRKSDGVIGLYDVVNNQFYTNSGTGTFTKGPDKILKISRAYIGTEQVRPKKETWVLYKETDFKNSSFGGFRTAGWYNASSPSYTGFNTTDGYIYSTSSHSRCKICPDTSDLALFQSAKAVKVVCDGFYIGNNTNTYESHIALLSYWRPFGKKSSGMVYPTIISGNAPTYGVWYSAEAIIWNDSTWRVTLSDGSVFGIDNDNGAWDTLVSTGSGGWFYPSASDNLMPIAELFKDQGTTCNLKDIHVYLLF